MPKGHPNKRYIPEFKIKVVETMQKGKMSYKETAREFEIPQGDKTVATNGSVFTLKKAKKDFT